MPTYHDIQLRFIRRRDNGVPEENPLLDDLLRVTKLGENNLRVTYTERSEDGVLRDTVVMGYQRFFHYMWRLLWLLSIDADPFLSVQMMIPTYPTVLIPVSTLNQQIPAVLDILMNICWQWPVVLRETVLPPRPSPLQTPQSED